MLNSMLLSPLRSAIPILALFAAMACGGGGGGGGGGGDGQVSAPLKGSSDGRRLVEGSITNATPVLILGDAPQSLIVNVTVADADTYFATRAAQGFNAAWVNVLCQPYTGGRPDGSTYDGIKPFTATTGGYYDLDTPNELYFQRVDAMVEAADQHGFHLWLDPIETGDHLPTLRANGLASARAYGRFLGRRYKDANNIVWMSGNDFRSWQDTPSDDELVYEVALGIWDEDKRHLQTTELDDPLSSSLEDSRWLPLLGINDTYTYFPTYAQLYVDWQRNPHLPNVFIEGNYEGEALGYTIHVTGPVDVRNTLWWSLTSGAAGAFYGNKWIHDFLPDWQNHLHDPGAEQHKYARALLGAKRWYDLMPDIGHVVATSGYGTFSDNTTAQDNDFVTTARTSDGRLVMSYFPKRRSLTIAMSQLSGSATATWFDPTTGNSFVDSASPVANVGSHVFTPPATAHSDGAADWVLLLEVGG
jgi:Protein of unknown function (DUF4038)/Putative collagen-binding domain of a collagenase